MHVIPGVRPRGSGSFPSGTKMLFQQSTAPTGWVKQTTHNDKALRVVSGTAGSGGATAFTTVFGAGKSTGAHALTETELPNHKHVQRYASSTTTVGTAVTWSATGGGGTVAPGPRSISDGNGTATNLETQGTGSGAGHSHGLLIDLQYVDIIVAEKD